jgi:hypothetical protein
MKYGRREFLIGAAAGAVGLAASNNAIGSSQAGSPDPNFHVYLAFGQSNMEGFPGIEAQDKTGVDKRFQMLAAVDFANLGRKKGEWYNAVPPLCRTSTGLCPADFFGRTMVAEHRSGSRSASLTWRSQAARSNSSTKKRMRPTPPLLPHG